MIMGIEDVKKIIDNIAQRPLAFCGEDEIETENGYIITTKENYDKLSLLEERVIPMEVEERDDGFLACPRCEATDQHGHNWCDQCGQRPSWSKSTMK